MFSRTNDSKEAVPTLSYDCGYHLQKMVVAQPENPGYFMFKTAILVLEGLVDVDLAKKLVS